MKEQIEQILYNGSTNLKDYFKDVVDISGNISGIPNLRISTLSTYIHNLFIQKQVEMLTLLMDGSREYERVVRFDDIEDLIQTLKKELV